MIVITAGVNLVLGVTMATSAAMMTGWHQRSTADYTALQAAGAIATVLILLLLARIRVSLSTIGVVSCIGVFVGGMVNALSRSPLGYALGFILVVGFDKMVNVFIRTHRSRIIPVADSGKATGVIVLLNNLSQPLAGLLVGAHAAVADADADSRAVILTLTLSMGAIAIVAERSWQRALLVQCHLN